MDQEKLRVMGQDVVSGVNRLYETYYNQGYGTDRAAWKAGVDQAVARLVIDCHVFVENGGNLAAAYARNDAAKRGGPSRLVVGARARAGADSAVWGGGMMTAYNFKQQFAEAVESQGGCGDDK